MDGICGMHDACGTHMSPEKTKHNTRVRGMMQQSKIEVSSALKKTKS